MTDNEKRAHDLTMLYMEKQMDKNYYDVVKTEHYDKERNIDYVTSYTDLYLSIFDRLNQDLF